MIKRIALLVTVLVLALSLGAPALAAETGKGVIEGILVNKTQGGGGVVDQLITLKIYKNDTETGSKTAKTLADGKFAFTELITDTGYSYLVTLTYQGADYEGDRISFGKEETKKLVEMVVYDSTAKDDAIRIEVSHVLVYPQEGSLLIKEYFQFTNDSDKTYIGAKDPSSAELVPTLRFSLPKGYSELQYDGLMECCIVNIDDGVADSMAVMPGQKEILIQYRVPYKSTEFNFSQKANHPLTAFNFLVQGEGLSVTSGKLIREDPVNMEGQVFSYYSAKDLAKGDIVTAAITGLPKSSSVGTIIVWTGGTLAVLAGGFVLTQRRNRKAGPLKAAPADNFSRKRQRLLSELARLDDEFEAGNISQEVYKKQRAEKKAQLVELMRGARDVSGKG